MKIGYPCINRSIGCLSSRTFRLKSYSTKRLIQTVEGNLNCLLDTLDYNKKNGILFFRITSDLVPFASHPVCTFNWQKHFRPKFQEIGDFIKKHGSRVSMHPDQFTLINSISEEVWERSVRELRYHAQILDLMNLDLTAKIQIHVGGVYGNKPQSIKRFVGRYARLEKVIKRRLVVENDHRSYSLEDCMKIHEFTGIPVVFDVFHHQILNQQETLNEALESVSKTWNKKDDIPIVDYSSQEKGKKTGSHAQSLVLSEFKRFLKESAPIDFDIMLEIKDKEKSARRAIKAAKEDRRLVTGRES